MSNYVYNQAKPSRNAVMESSKSQTPQTYAKQFVPAYYDAYSIIQSNQNNINVKNGSQNKVNNNDMKYNFAQIQYLTSQQKQINQNKQSQIGSNATQSTAIQQDKYSFTNVKTLNKNLSQNSKEKLPIANQPRQNYHQKFQQNLQEKQSIYRPPSNYLQRAQVPFKDSILTNSQQQNNNQVSTHYYNQTSTKRYTSCQTNQINPISQYGNPKSNILNQTNSKLQKQEIISSVRNEDYFQQNGQSKLNQNYLYNSQYNPNHNTSMSNNYIQNQQPNANKINQNISMVKKQNLQNFPRDNIQKQSINTPSNNKSESENDRYIKQEKVNEERPTNPITQTASTQYQTQNMEKQAVTKQNPVQRPPSSKPNNEKNYIIKYPSNYYSSNIKHVQAEDKQLPINSNAINNNSQLATRKNENQSITNPIPYQQVASFNGKLNKNDDNIINMQNKTASKVEQSNQKAISNENEEVKPIGISRTQRLQDNINNKGAAPLPSQQKDSKLSKENPPVTQQVENNFNKNNSNSYQKPYDHRILASSNKGNYSLLNPGSSIMAGFPNIGLTCYINSALQSLRQIYLLDKEIFTKSSFGQQLIKLFKELETKGEVVQSLQQILNLSKTYQEHRGGGDAYICVINFLTEIKKDITSESHLQQFDKVFVLSFKDQLFCVKCSSPLEDTNDFVASYISEDIGLETNQLDGVFSDKSDLDSGMDESYCKKCKKIKQAYGLKVYLNAPKFMFVRVANPLERQEKNIHQLIKKRFDCILENQTSYQYEIIGFCNYFGYHYTYTANYQNNWIEYNDSRGNYTEPNNQKAIYYLLKRIN